ncbi:uncharacterized protein BDR25DRAFT_340106 [Lindgomyces ingoldianus]|uniref:Uncharacterized protein n=1 Tax=Lindgomyces ingoldianus TaxID=673940 RepID=A0ACB6RAC9_9PLEO|nr:uncharacterized protein BDR25DRAFT_340106 [Lindgomyces ingoldianus]KAF2475295.1 hypothetical protein BDR25DRAFT_340106 [Lindgomyces ingoldianus]
MATSGGSSASRSPCGLRTHSAHTPDRCPASEDAKPVFDERTLRGGMCCEEIAVAQMRKGTSLIREHRGQDPGCLSSRSGCIHHAIIGKTSADLCTLLRCPSILLGNGNSKAGGCSAVQWTPTTRTPASRGVQLGVICGTFRLLQLAGEPLGRLKSNARIVRVEATCMKPGRLHRPLTNRQDSSNVCIPSVLGPKAGKDLDLFGDFLIPISTHLVNSPSTLLLAGTPRPLLLSTHFTQDPALLALIFSSSPMLFHCKSTYARI